MGDVGQEATGLSAAEFRELVDKDFDAAVDRVQSKNFAEVCLLIRAKLDDYNMQEKLKDMSLEELLADLPIRFYA